MHVDLIFVKFPRSIKFPILFTYFHCTSRVNWKQLCKKKLANRCFVVFHAILSCFIIFVCTPFWYIFSLVHEYYCTFSPKCYVCQNMCKRFKNEKKKFVKVSHSSMFLHEEFLVMYIIEMCRHNILKNKKIMGGDQCSSLWVWPFCT